MESTATLNKVIVLDENTHKLSIDDMKSGTIIIIKDQRDTALFAIAQGALVTGTTLISGLKMPEAPIGHVWKVSSRCTAQLVAC